MSYAKRTDANHAEIRDALRKAGYPVLDLSGCGMGIPDLSVLVDANRKISIFLEVKDGSKPPSARKLTDAEVKFSEFNGWNTAVVTSFEDAVKAIEEYKQLIR